MSSHGVKNKHQIATTTLKKISCFFEVPCLWIIATQTALIFFFSLVF